MRGKIFMQGLAVLLALLIAYHGTAVNATAETLSVHPGNTLRYRGEAIFRGVFLADGEVAKLFPEIWESPAMASFLEQSQRQHSPEELAAGRDRVIQSLNKQDPIFFRRFGMEMQSGDRLRIQQALTEAGERMLKEIENSVQKPGGPSPDGLYTHTETYAYTMYYFAGAVAAVVAVVGFIAGMFSPTGYKDSHLQRDLMVELIAKRLGPATSGN